MPARVAWGLAVLVAASLAAAPAVRGEDDPRALWPRTEAEVLKTLDERSLVDLALHLRTSPPPSSPAERLRRFDLFVRAGHRDDALAALPGLAKKNAGMAEGVLGDVAMTLLEREEWELAARLLEVAPTTEAGWTYLLLRHWRTTGKSVAEIDSWLRARQPAKPEYWIKVRGQFLTEAGQSEALLRELAGDVRARRADASAVKLYLAVAGDREPLSWLAGAYRPARPWDAYEIGSRLVDRAPDVAVALLERAVAMPLTDADIREAVRDHQLILPPGEAKALVSTGMRRDLARAYQKNGQADRAQAVLEMLVRDQAKGPLDPFLAGMEGGIQADSGARVVESRIRSDEAARKDSPLYWLGRAEYYAGRREERQAEDAYRQALARAPAAVDAPRPKGPDERSRVLDCYVGFLVRGKRVADATVLLRREMDEAAADDWAAGWALEHLLSLASSHAITIDPNDPLLWGFLGKRSTWDGHERQLLERLLTHTVPGDRDGLIARAETLAATGDPSRATTLGELLEGLNESRRAVPLLKAALPRLTDEAARQSVRFTLLQAYLDLGDWRAAEGIFPLAQPQLTPREHMEWRPRIAVLAARAGAPEDALRLWAASANHDLTDLRQLDDMVGAGMRDRLRVFYSDLAQRDPVSRVPATALARLR